MHKFILKNFTSHRFINYHVVLIISIAESKPEMPHTVYKCQFVRRRSIVNSNFFSFNYFFLSNYCVADA